MTMFDDEFNRIFKRMSSSFFNIDDLFEEFKTEGNPSGPYYYGYSMTIGRITSYNVCYTKLLRLFRFGLDPVALKQHPVPAQQEVVL